MIITFFLCVGIWALVNNAGIAGSVGPVDWLTRRDYEAVMSVNLYGIIDMTNACLPLLRKEKTPQEGKGACRQHDQYLWENHLGSYAILCL